MFWTFVFAISISQAVFLISLLTIKGAKNKMASGLMSCMLIIMLFTNLGYLVIRTDLVNYIPQLFGLPFGMIFLFGPLFYFYSNAVIEQDFRWKKIYWLHFLPYAAQLTWNMPVLLMSKSSWLWFVSTFLAGNLPIQISEKILFALQDLHLLVYIFFTLLWIKKAKTKNRNAQYIVSLDLRIKWLSALFYCFILFLATVFILYLIILFKGYYHPVTNYIYTVVSSLIIYFIAYKLVLTPELISPDFAQKYKAYMQFEGEDGMKYIQKLTDLMEQSKVFTDPDLKLTSLAHQIGLPSHQVSKLINEKFGKSFNEFINEYRVREFINRMNQPGSHTYTIYGLALDVGFNSKSSFNAAFKKITGKNPSDYKTAS